MRYVFEFDDELVVFVLLIFFWGVDFLVDLVLEGVVVDSYNKWSD